MVWVPVPTFFIEPVWPSDRDAVAIFSCYNYHSLPFQWWSSFPHGFSFSAPKHIRYPSTLTSTTVSQAGGRFSRSQFPTWRGSKGAGPFSCNLINAGFGFFVLFLIFSIHLPMIWCIIPAWRHNKMKIQCFLPLLAECFCRVHSYSHGTPFPVLLVSVSSRRSEAKTGNASIQGAEPGMNQRNDVHRQRGVLRFWIRCQRSGIFLFSYPQTTVGRGSLFHIKKINRKSSEVKEKHK